MTSLHSDNEKLEFVFLKLGLAETDNDLENIVNKFLPPVLLMVSKTDDGIRTKVLELLTHLNKRLKSRDSVLLPVQNLVTQLNDDAVNTFVKNFTITYIKLGVPRMKTEDRLKILPLLFSSVEGKPKNQQDILLRLVAENLPLVRLNNSHEKDKDIFKFYSYSEGTRLLLDFFLDIMLMPYRLPTGDAGTSGTTYLPPPGLSPSAMQRLVVDSKIWPPEQIESIKNAILNFIKADLFNEDDVVCHIVVASSDTKHSVADTAEIELRRKKSSIDWNRPFLTLKLYKIYLGYAGVSAKKISAAHKREPASARMKLELVSNLMRSTSAGECFPQSIQLIYDGLFGKTNVKLQRLTLQFIHHITDKLKGGDILQKQAPLILDALMKTSANQDMNEACRGLAFVGLGKLAKKSPNLFSKKMEIIEGIFQDLSKEESSTLKSSIQEAIIMLAPAYANTNDDQLIRMESLIESSIGSNDHHLQTAGIQYANTIFPSNHIPSRYLLLLAIGDPKDVVATQAHKALFKTTKRTEDNDEDIQLPSFSLMLTFVHGKARERLLKGKGHSIGHTKTPFPSKAFHAIFVYLRMCLLNDPQVEYDGDVSDAESKLVVKQLRKLINENESKRIVWLRQYVDLFCQYLTVTSDPFITSLMLEVIAGTPPHISVDELLLPPGGESNDSSNTVATRVAWIKRLTIHTNEKIRPIAAEIYAIIIQRNQHSFDKYSELMSELLRDCSDKVLEVKHGSFLLVGYIVGDWLRLQNRFQSDVMEVQNIEMQQNIVKAIAILVESAENERDQRLAAAACTSLGEMARKAALPLVDGGDDAMSSDDKNAATKWDVVKCLLTRLNKKTAHKLREQAVTSLGRLPVGDQNFPHTEKVLLELLGSAEIKDVELHFSVGAALCSAALGLHSFERFSRWEEGLEREENQEKEDKLAWLIEKILSDFVPHRTPAVRQASGIWLMVMLKTSTCCKHPAILEHLIQLQEAFQNLLLEPDDLTQDIASKGFGIVYELADADLKKTLVDQLVDSLTGSSKAPSSKVRIIGQEGSTLFQGASAQLGKAPDGSSVSTYKELCSLASDLNQPDLVYKFLHLANHHSHWNTKKGAAFGFRDIVVAAREELQPHLPRIVPRLYRYTFDPQLSVRSAMSSIWNVLAADPKKLVDEYFDLILEDLLRNLTDNTWRTRQASCHALASFLQGRGVSFSDKDASTSLLISKLPTLWSRLFRVRDDIKETVRNAAEDACSVIKKITIRLCSEVNSGTSNDENLSDILTVLITEGLSSSVDEVKKLSLSTLVEISKVCGKLIKPCIAQMVIKLIEALSGTEAPILNYLHTRSSEVTQDALDMARALSVKTNPLMETAVRCLEQSDESVLTELIPPLVDLTKRGVGVLTKAGCAQAIKTIVSICKNDVTPYCGKLINALLSGLTDRSLAVRKMYSETIGHLATIATDAALEKTLKKMKTWYIEKEDESSKQASVGVVYSVARRSPDILNRHSRLVLPLAFYGMQELITTNVSSTSSSSEKSRSEKDDIAMSAKEMWEAIWNEFTPGLESALRLYMVEITELSSTCLQSNQWTVKAQAAVTLSCLIKNQRPGTLDRSHVTSVLQVLIDGLRGRTWEGKHHLLIALRHLSVHCSDQISPEQLDLISSTLFKEGNRNKLTYSVDAIISLAYAAEANKLDVFGQFWQLASPILKQGDSTASSDEDSVPSNHHHHHRKSGLWELKVKVLNSLPKAWRSSSVRTKVQLSRDVFELLASYASASTHAMQLAALQVLASVLPTLKDVKLEVQSTDGEKSHNTVEWLSSVISEPLCSGLDNMKFSSTREEAFAATEAYVDLLSSSGKYSNIAHQLDMISSALTASPLNSSSSSFYERVQELFKRVSGMLPQKESTSDDA